MSTRGYDAVIFDLWGTLVPSFTAAEYRVMLNAMAEAVGADPGRFAEAWTHGFEERNLGVIATTHDAVVATCSLFEHVAAEDGLGRACELRRDFTRRFLLSPRSDAVGTLEELRARGLAVGLISDCTAEVPEVWPETALHPRISDPVFSCREGVRKPDPRIYALACERLGVEPSRCLYIGDGGSNELTGAADVGMRAVQIVPRGADEAARARDPVNWSIQSWDGERISALSASLEIVRA